MDTLTPAAQADPFNPRDPLRLTSAEPVHEQLVVLHDIHDHRAVIVNESGYPVRVRSLRIRYQWLDLSTAPAVWSHCGGEAVGRYVVDGNVTPMVLTTPLSPTSPLPQWIDNLIREYTPAGPPSPATATVEAERKIYGSTQAAILGELADLDTQSIKLLYRAAMAQRKMLLSLVEEGWAAPSEDDATVKLVSILGRALEARRNLGEGH